MKNLLFAFLTVVVIAGCGDNPTDSNEFEPYEVGTWLITSPTSAEWIGETSTQSKIKTMQSDTIEIKQPGDQSLEIWRDDSQPKNLFTMQFVDSTISHATYQDKNVGEPIFDIPEGVSSYPISPNAVFVSVRDDYMKSKFIMSYIDEYEFKSDNPIILIKYPKEDGSLFRVYAIHVNGIEDAIKQVL